MNFLETLQQADGFCSFSGATIVEIQNAEKSINTIFATDYKEIVLEFGAISVYGHELTGVCEVARLNVVEITNKERENNQNVSDQFYVIEQSHIDGIVIWQNHEGGVYKTTKGGNLVKIFNSLKEYLLH